MKKHQSEKSPGDAKAEESLLGFAKQLWRRLRSQFRQKPRESTECPTAEPSAASERNDRVSASTPTQSTKQSISQSGLPSIGPTEAASGTSKSHSGYVANTGSVESLPSSHRQAADGTGSQRYDSRSQTSEDTTQSSRRVLSHSFEYWDFPAEAPEREPPPSTISETERSRLTALLKTSSNLSMPGDEELFIIVGLDMGTSTTKTIVRLPFEAGEPAIAIPAPSPCRLLCRLEWAWSKSQKKVGLELDIVELGSCGLNMSNKAATAIRR